MFDLSSITNLVDPKSFDGSSIANFVNGIANSVSTPASSTLLITAFGAMFGLRYLGPVFFPLLNTVSYTLSMLTSTVCYFLQTLVGSLAQLFRNMITLSGMQFFRLTRSKTFVACSSIALVALIGFSIYSVSRLSFFAKTPHRVAGAKQSLGFFSEEGFERF